MTDTNPVVVEQAIRACSDRIAQGVIVCDRRYTAFLEADHALDVAFAHAYMAHQGAAHEKKYAAEIATETQRKARDVADAAYRFADRQAKALEAELRSWQSVNASLRAMYATAGVGVGA